MIRTALALLAATGASALSGCGAAQTAGRPTPPPALNESVYIGPSAVSVSPATVGGGPLIIAIANQATRALRLSVASRGSGGRTIALSGPIDSASFGQLSVDLAPGRYTLSATPAAGTHAQLAGGSGVVPAALTVTAQRPSGESALLTP